VSWVEDNVDKLDVDNVNDFGIDGLFLLLYIDLFVFESNETITISKLELLLAFWLIVLLIGLFNSSQLFLFEINSFF
jgi:hypothetical protein